MGDALPGTIRSGMWTYSRTAVRRDPWKLAPCCLDCGTRVDEPSVYYSRYPPGLIGPAPKSTPPVCKGCGGTRIEARSVRRVWIRFRLFGWHDVAGYWEMRP